MKRVRVAMLGLVLLSACVSNAHYQAVPSAAPGFKSRDLYAAAKRVLARDGASFRESDGDSRNLATEWVFVDQVLITKRFHSWRVMASDGELEILIECRLQNGDDPTPATCDDTTRNEGWAARVPALRDRILAEARRQSAQSSSE